ncbi:hypothetical protein [Glutamicibacter sp. AOP5-A2-18]|uniref:hypothetical protein n=1 Tax=Glutamicibacter sp. AOP5-A2-18 TaxID=3457656 RepID=UPI004033F6BD
MASRTIGPVTGATTAAAAVTTIVFYILGLLGIDAPGEVQGAVTTLLVIIAGYLVPTGKDPGDHVAE